LICTISIECTHEFNCMIKRFLINTLLCYYVNLSVRLKDDGEGVTCMMRQPDQRGKWGQFFMPSCN
jgi:hypothetical protein